MRSSAPFFFLQQQQQLFRVQRQGKRLLPRPQHSLGQLRAQQRRVCSHPHGAQERNVAFRIRHRPDDREAQGAAQ